MLENWVIWTYKGESNMILELTLSYLGENVREQGNEEDIWTYKGESNMILENAA
jgi:hypothetical protein